MSSEAYNYWSIVLGAASFVLSFLTLAALGLYTLFTYWLLRATQSELKVMQDQLTNAQASSASTQKELEILQGQLVTAQTALDVQRDRERRAATPVFVWLDGVQSDTDPFWARIEFKNKGGPITVLETRARNCLFKISPANYIGTDGEGLFSIDHVFNDSVRYVGLKYITMANDIQTVVFRLETNLPTSPRLDVTVPFDQMERMPVPPQPVDLIPSGETSG